MIPTNPYDGWSRECRSRTGDRAMAIQSVFPTFCHISEFGPEAYRKLSVMAALSRPLVLWAPSISELDATANCHVDAAKLLRLLEKPPQPGQSGIRIAGRKDWLYNGPRRQKRSGDWDGARWTKEDEAIKTIARDDEKEPRDKQRVMIIDEEDGYDRADEFLGAHPESSEKISHLVLKGRIPPGTRQRIESQKLTGAVAAREVLRDARNHGKAIRDTGTKLPFLTLEYARFIELINEMDDPLDDLSPRLIETRSFKVFARTTLDLLEELSKLGRPDVELLIASPAHQKMAEWMDHMLVFARGKKTGEIERLMLEELCRDVGKEFPKLRPQIDVVDDFHLFGQLFLELVLVTCDPFDAWGWGRLAFAIKEHGRKLLARFGYVTNFDEMQWLFLYVFGHRPNNREAEMVHHLLKTKVRNMQPSPK
jgi:hypothetical protein